MKNKRVFNLIIYVIPITLVLVIIFVCYNWLILDNDTKNNDDVKVGDINYIVIFDKNGATSIEKSSYKCTTNGNCTVTMPNIKIDDGYVLGWSITNGKKATYKVGDIVLINENTTFYAITYRQYEVSIVDDKLSYISNNKVSCKAYNKEENCQVSIPNYNKTGYENRGYSLFSDSLTGTIFPTNNYVINKNMTLYPIYNTLSRKQVINVASTVNRYDIIFEIEKNCNSNVYNEYLNYFGKISKKAKYLLIGSKISFLNSDTFDKIWGKQYIGMNYGPSSLRLFDVRCPNLFSRDYYATIVHELSHTWDFYYSNYFTKTISEENDVINLYTKYKEMSKRPFREYSYSNIKEFFADSYKYYYFKYIDPDIYYSKLDYPSDIKKVIERYICITNNGYTTYKCN